jgi:two-component system phosphate regulon response regulator PhoB
LRKLLLVEDDTSLGETLKERLAKENYDVEWAQTYAAAAEFIGGKAFDLIILDVGLPDGDGFQLAKEVRRKTATPFLFVTAMNSAEHRLAGYELGAEEFIPKPFLLKELLLRIKHVLDEHAPVSEVKIGELTIDLEAQVIISRDGSKEFLAARDFQLLKFLIEASPRVISRDDILNAIWGEDKFPSTRTVDNAIVRLRQATRDTGGRLIRSVRGVGYQWAAGLADQEGEKDGE